MDRSAYVVSSVATSGGLGTPILVCDRYEDAEAFVNSLKASAASIQWTISKCPWASTKHSFDGKPTQNHEGCPLRSLTHQSNGQQPGEIVLTFDTK